MILKFDLTHSVKYHYKIKSKILSTVISIVLFSSCSLFLPEPIEIQWEKDYKLIQKSVLSIIPAEEVDIFPNCQKANGIEHHFIKIIVRNPNSTPKLNEDKQKIVNEILLKVYPDISNISRYEVIGVGFETKVTVGSGEQTNFWSASIETKNLNKLHQ